ncbi:D-Ala-D-Ala carboxypeptidase family metallohydrolase [Acinetobacter nectaris]|uniref:D-Ala-D-Ala carboxypeptidase family metallohydrolase n=1 Tax=Acinetobacter nectaris TaxID=1219382 RepID=UPI001F258B76|nr:D-Ala-D-Ala carboxypeptidase family metallohydrolase [Acinetobacter nectaris]MCF9046653.1 peptidase M15 [Acinetobacter nectaris]
MYNPQKIKRTLLALTLTISGASIFAKLPAPLIVTPIPSYYLTKKIPSSYFLWVSQKNHLQKVKAYEDFLTKHDVNNVIPTFELLRTARDWKQCGREEYLVPPKELWENQVPTLKVFRYLTATKTLTNFEVTSAYRDFQMNRCAGGAVSSRHILNAAMDFRIGPEHPTAKDYTNIEKTKFKLCQFWKQYGPDLKMGLGTYSSGQIHIDTQGYRTWGPDHTQTSSICL